MSLLMTNVNQLSLRDLRKQFRGDLLVKDAARFANLGSKVPLELLDSVADFAFLGKKFMNNKNARDFLSQLSQLSGTKDDGHISEFRSELTEVKVNDFEPARQVLFLKPIKSSLKPDSQFAIQSPLIIYEYGNEITVLIPSLSDPEIHLKMTINKNLTKGSDAETQLVDFINKANQMEYNVGTGIASIYGKIGFDNEVIEAVMKKMKTS